MLLAAGDMTQARAAVRLKLSAQLVGYHARALVGQGILQVATGGRRGQWTTYRRGDRWPLFEEALHGDKNADRRLRSAHRTPATLHRGHQGFQVAEVLAADLTKADGWQSMKLHSKVPNHIFRHRDSAGRPWTMSLRLGRRRSSVVVYPPPIVKTTAEEVDEAAAAWRSRLEKEAHCWATKVGVRLVTGSGFDVAPLEVAVGAGLPQFGVPGQTPAWVDSTPRNGNLEGWPGIAAAVMRLPDLEVIVASIKARLDRLMPLRQADDQRATDEAWYDWLCALSDDSA